MIAAPEGLHGGTQNLLLKRHSLKVGLDFEHGDHRNWEHNSTTSI